MSLCLLWSYVSYMTMAPTEEDMGRTTIQVSEQLADELHDRKERGESYEDVIWRLIHDKERVAEDLPGEGGGVYERATESESEPEPIAEPDREAVDREQLREEVAGSGELAQARAGEILKMYDLLREEGEAEKTDLLEVVDVDATGYADRESVWANMVKGRDTLRALPGVEKPSTGRTQWRYSKGDGSSGVYDPTEEF